MMTLCSWEMFEIRHLDWTECLAMDTWAFLIILVEGILANSYSQIEGIIVVKAKGEHALK
jgi:hypothetical protein